MSTYKIVRQYMHHEPRTLDTGLTLEEAQAHCSDPETSSSTCTLAANVKRTAERGAWFDSYTEE